jgi:hypothetical protein
MTVPMTLAIITQPTRLAQVRGEKVRKSESQIYAENADLICVSA